MSLKDYEIVKKIGDGSYSTVFQVRRLQDNKLYALKKVKISSLKEKEKRNALNEVRILASIRHPNIVSYKDAFFDEETGALCLVMEYADSGDLQQRIKLYQQQGKFMSEKFVWSLVIQLACGLKILHDLKIIHRDIKCANVFLNSDGKVKIGDLNVSKVITGCLENTQTGTPYYASPEVWKDKPYDYRSDLWSLGCVVYESICLKPPFNAEDMQGLFKKVVKGEYPPLPRTFSKDLHLVVNGLIQVNPVNRLRCEQILAMPGVMKRMTDGLVDKTENLLLKTIQFAGPIQKIAENLPKANFEEEKSEKKGILPEVKNFRDRSVPARGYFRERENSEKSLQSTKLYKKSVLKYQFGAGKLPKVGNQVRSVAKNLPVKEFFIVPRVKSQKLSLNPTSNRSLVRLANS